MRRIVNSVADNADSALFQGDVLEQLELHIDQSTFILLQVILESLVLMAQSEAQVLQLPNRLQFFHSALLGGDPIAFTFKLLSFFVSEPSELSFRQFGPRLLLRNHNPSLGHRSHTMLDRLSVGLRKSGDLLFGTQLRSNRQRYLCLLDGLLIDELNGGFGRD